MAFSAQVGTSIFQTDSRRYTLTAFVGFLVAAGLINSLIAAFIFCRLPDSHAPSLWAVFVRAFVYVAASVAAGIAGSRIYWIRSCSPFKLDPSVTFGLFALTSAATWVWVPAAVLLSTQDSPACVMIAALGAAMLGSGLRKIVPLVNVFTQSPIQEVEQAELFEQCLESPRREFHAFAVALCIYAASYALIRADNLVASALLAPCAFLIAWKLTLAPDFLQTCEEKHTSIAWRLAANALFALLITFMALQMGVASRNKAAAELRRGGESNQQDGSSARSSQSGITGYASIILWPLPEKKEIIAPVPHKTQALAPGTARPIVIRFDGAYWYFQPPGKRPGAGSHIARGNPLSSNIRSNNSMPLTMQAHQELSRAVPLAHMGEVVMAIENREDRPGGVALGILLTDSASRGKPTLYLGQQEVSSAEVSHFSAKSSLSSEVLRFPIPQQAKVRRFDEITVFFFPDTGRSNVGPKIAIQQFEIRPLE